MYLCNSEGLCERMDKAVDPAPENPPCVCVKVYGETYPQPGISRISSLQLLSHIKSGSYELATKLLQVLIITI